LKKLLFIIFLVSILISGCEKSEIDEELPEKTGIVADANDTDQTLEDNETDTNETVTTTPTSCTDSDDGKKYKELGYVLINGSKDYMDSCISELIIREYYCSETAPGKVTFDVHTCLDICEEGICTITPVETNSTNSTNESNST